MLTQPPALWLAEEDTVFNPDIVSPGVIGFIMTAVLAVMIILLGVSLVGRLRRNAYRDDIREELKHELDAQNDDAESGGNVDPRN